MRRTPHPTGGHRRILSRLCSLLYCQPRFYDPDIGDSLGQLDLLRLAGPERRAAQLLDLAFEPVQRRVVGALANYTGDIGPESVLDLLWNVVSVGTNSAVGGRWAGGRRAPPSSHSRSDVFVSSTVSCSTAACSTRMSVTPVEERMLATACDKVSRVRGTPPPGCYSRWGG